MRLIQAACCLAAMIALASPALAGRCVGYANDRIVWCDDFDNYCTANNPTNPWPGYPPSPDTRCPTDGTAVADGSFFRSPLNHWQSICTAYGGSSIEPVTTAGSVYNQPFSMEYQGGGNSTQRHELDLTTIISTRHPGTNAINGSDASPLILRYWGWCPPGGGAYPNSPMYVELMLGNDHAPTDYVQARCGPNKWVPDRLPAMARHSGSRDLPAGSPAVFMRASPSAGWLNWIATPATSETAPSRPCITPRPSTATSGTISARTSSRASETSTMMTAARGLS